MKTNAMEAAEQAKVAFRIFLAANQCHCGRFKWDGFCFCFRCLENLPTAQRHKLYGKSEDDLRQAYEEVKAWLEETTTRENSDGTENR